MIHIFKSKENDINVNCYIYLEMNMSKSFKFNKDRTKNTMNKYYIFFLKSMKIIFFSIF